MLLWLARRRESAPALLAANPEWDIEVLPSRYSRSQFVAAAAAGVAIAVASLMNSEESTRCESPKILWVDSYGTKASLEHER